MNLTLPVITTCKVVTYKRKGIAKKEKGGLVRASQ